MSLCACGAETSLGRKKCLQCRKLAVDERNHQNAEHQQRRRDRLRREALKRREAKLRREAAANYPEYVAFLESRGIEPVSASEYANRVVHERDHPDD